MKNKPEKKVLIINWKWKQFQDSHVNENVLTQEELGHYAENIDSGRGRFFEEFVVEKSIICPDAILVAANIYKDKINDTTRDLLYALINKYAQSGNRVLICLHRSNFYDENDVEDLLEHFKKKVAKCFLFAFGRDYLYYHTRRSGLLNDSGGFFRGRDPVTDERIETYDKQNGIVKQPYFDRVWQYYEMEFQVKIFNLKEELFDCWLPLLLSTANPKVPREALIKTIQESDERQGGRAIFLRLKSFLGFYDQEQLKLRGDKDFDRKRALDKELKILKDLEKQEGESYLFDDCIANLEHDHRNGRYLVKEVYNEAKKRINRLLFDGKGSTSINKRDLLKISQDMEQLIRVIPGEIE